MNIGQVQAPVMFFLEKEDYSDSALRDAHNHLLKRIKCQSMNNISSTSDVITHFECHGRVFDSNFLIRVRILPHFELASPSWYNRAGRRHRWYAMNCDKSVWLFPSIVMTRAGVAGHLGELLFGDLSARSRGNTHQPHPPPPRSVGRDTPSFLFRFVLLFTVF